MPRLDHGKLESLVAPGGVACLQGDGKDVAGRRKMVAGAVFLQMASTFVSAQQQCRWESQLKQVRSHSTTLLIKARRRTSRHPACRIYPWSICWSIAVAHGVVCYTTFVCCVDTRAGEAVLRSRCCSLCCWRTRPTTTWVFKTLKESEDSCQAFPAQSMSEECVKTGLVAFDIIMLFLMCSLSSVTRGYKQLGSIGHQTAPLLYLPVRLFSPFAQRGPLHRGS